MNFAGQNLSKIETRVVSMNLCPVEDYTANHSYTHDLNVKGHHIQELNNASMGGNNFSTSMIAKSLGSAITHTQSRGVIPLGDSGERTVDAVNRQYRQRRYAFQLNIEWRSPIGDRGAITFAGFTDRAEIVNGTLPGNLVLTFNSMSKYLMVPDGQGGHSNQCVFSGRLHPKQPKAPIRLNPNQITDSLTSFGGFASGGFGGGDGGQQGNFGRISTETVGANLANDARISNSINIDTRLIESFSGDSYKNGSTSKTINNLFKGYQQGSKEVSDRISDNSGKWADEESRDLFGSGGNGLSSIWTHASSYDSHDSAPSSDRVIGMIKDAVPSFEANCQIPWNSLRLMFRNIEKETQCYTKTMHEDYQNIYGMANNPRNHNANTMEGQLARQIAGSAPSIISTLSYTRFSFQMTNKGTAIGGSRDKGNVLLNLDHPFLNNAPQQLNKHNQETLQHLIREIAPYLGDHGHRSYMLEVHYAWNADLRVYLDIGNGRKEFTLANFPDATSSLSSSFNHNSDLKDFTQKISSIHDVLTGDNDIEGGTSFASQPTGFSSQPKFGGNFKPSFGIKKTTF